MSPELIGAIAGGVFAILNFFALQAVATQVEKQAAARQESAPKAAPYIRMAAWADLLIFPVIGYIVAPLVLAG